MRTVDRLRLNRRIPPRVQQKHVFRGREVEPHASRFQTDQKKRALGIVLKALNDRLAIRRFSIEVSIVSIAGGRDACERCRESW